MAEVNVLEGVGIARHIGPDEACLAATGFLLEHTGIHLVVGQPQVMVSALRTVWIVPVNLSYLPVGVLGTVGVVAVDEETSQVIA